MKIQLTGMPALVALSAQAAVTVQWGDPLPGGVSGATDIVTAASNFTRPAATFTRGNV